MAILETADLSKIYGQGDTAVRALDGVSIKVEKGEFVAVVGTSGSGKSTLLHMLGGLDRPTSGSVMVDGRDIVLLRDEELTIFRRRKIGFVFQNYNLVPVLNVYENIVLPVELDGVEPDETYIRGIVATLGLESKLTSLPGQLSGGQQQREPMSFVVVVPTGQIGLDFGGWEKGIQEGQHNGSQHDGADETEHRKAQNPAGTQMQFVFHAALLTHRWSVRTCSGT